MVRGDLTADLARLGAGGPAAWNQVIQRVYNELRNLAAAYLRRESSPGALQPTELVHEAYLRLVRQRQSDWKSRTHFYGVAAHLMRLILVDCARQEKCAKRGGPNACLLDITAVEPLAKPLELDGLVEALERLEKMDPRLSRIVELRFFAGMTVEEAAAALGISEKTVRRDWKVARAWLHGELRKESREP